MGLHPVHLARERLIPLRELIFATAGGGLATTAEEAITRIRWVMHSVLAEESPKAFWTRVHEENLAIQTRKEQNRLKTSKIWVILGFHVQ